MTKLPPAVEVKLDGLAGLISHETGMKLAELAAAVPVTQAIVEIGSFRGKSTCYLGAGAVAGHGAHVFAIDPWDLTGNIHGKHGFTDPGVRQDFAKQVAWCDLDEQITPVQGFSTEVAVGWLYPIGLLYIDGDHDYESVANDFAAWAPHLADECVVAFDDYRTPRNPGVERFVTELQQQPGWIWDLNHRPLAICMRNVE